MKNLTLTHHKQHPPMPLSNADRNRDKMSQILQDTGVTISAKEFHNWRATKPIQGDISGVGYTTILATDGLLGLFQHEDYDRQDRYFFGHISHFDGKVEGLFAGGTSYKYKAKPEKPKKEKSSATKPTVSKKQKIAVEWLTELLKEL